MSSTESPVAFEPATTIIVIGPHCWGRGDTVSEAAKKAKQSFSPALSGKWRYVAVMTNDPGAYVDAYGRLCRHADSAAPIEVERYRM